MPLLRERLHNKLTRSMSNNKLHLSQRVKASKMGLQLMAKTKVETQARRMLLPIKNSSSKTSQKPKQCKSNNRGRTKPIKSSLRRRKLSKSLKS